MNRVEETAASPVSSRGALMVKAPTTQMMKLMSVLSERYKSVSLLQGLQPVRNPTDCRHTHLVQ